MASVGGSVVWNLDLDSSKFTKGLATAASSAKAFGSSLDRGSIQNFGKFMGDAGESVNKLGSSINKAALPATIAIGAGMGIVGKMAFDQVNAVEQATLSLRAYEKDGRKVDAVLSDLLTYARSDLGVLFNRKDLFAAAQGLRVMGDDTSKLTDHVKIMSRSVGLGLSNWDDLTQIIGRVGSTGRLTGIDFDNLTKAGFQLDDSLRNTDITFNQLFKHLDKGIPVKAMEGQADSIRGIGVRVQTAFRGIGESILGVGRDTGKFIKGGAGDQLVKFFKDLPKVLADPAVQQAFKDVGQALADFARDALPKIVEFIKFLGRNIGTISKTAVALLAIGTALKIIGTAMSGISTVITLFTGLGLAFNYLTVAAYALSTALIVPIASILIVVGIIALLAAAAYIVIRNWDTLKRWLGTFWTWLKGLIATSWGVIRPILMSIGSFFASVFTKVANAVKTAVNAALAVFRWTLAIMLAIAFAILTPIFNYFKKVFNGIWSVVRTVFNAVKSFITATLSAIWKFVQPILSKIASGFKSAFNTVSSIFRSLLSLASNIWGRIWSVISSAISRIVSVVSGVKDKIVGVFGGAIGWLVDAGKNIVTGLWNGIKSLGGWIKDQVVGFVKDNVPGPILKLLGIQSPSKLFAGIGENIVRGLVRGIDSGRPMVESAVGRLTGSAMSPAMSVAGSGMGSGTAPVNVTLNMSGIMARSRGDMREISKDMLRTVNDELRAKGITPIGEGAI